MTDGDHGVVSNTLRRAWHMIFDRRPRALLGWVFSKFMRQRVQSMRRDFFGPRGTGFIERCLRAEVVHTYYSMDDREIRAANRREFWGSATSKYWHEYNEAKAAENFQERMAPKIQLLNWIEAYDRKSDVRTVCEIGTGMGHYLFLLRERLSEWKDVKFVGFDLNDACIQEARARNIHSDIEFHCGDAMSYIRREASAGTLYVCCGTLEYFTS